MRNALRRLPATAAEIKGIPGGGGVEDCAANPMPGPLERRGFPMAGDWSEQSFFEFASALPCMCGGAWYNARN
jgi:hypothetical protein